MIPIFIQQGNIMKIKGGNRPFIHISNPSTNGNTLYVCYDGTIQTFGNMLNSINVPPGSSLRLDNSGVKQIFSKNIYLTTISPNGENYNVQGVDESEVSYV